MAQYNIEHMAEQFKYTVFLSDDSETDDEPDKDYKSDKAIESERRILPLFGGFSDKDIIECMWKTVLDHKCGYMKGLASTTHLVCTIDGVHKPINFNGIGDHAEKKLISYLGKKGPMKLTIYINNSPCASCAKSLKQFLEENQNIQLILHVTHLYNIKRKSCKLRRDAGKDEKHIDHIFDEVHKDQYLELRNLMSLGSKRCRIESFTREVWETLLVVMDISEQSRKQIIQLYALKLNNYDRSRQGEDRRIRKDLNHIKSHSGPCDEF